MQINKLAQNLKVGDKVTCDYYPGQEEIVRTLTRIEPDPVCGSGYRASADGGEICSLCKRVPGTPVQAVDAAWFMPIPGKIK